MNFENSSLDNSVRCPECASGAVYKYGKSKLGKQRYLCLMCNKQFIPGVSRQDFKNRPVCQICKKPMSVYMKDEKTCRFRCSNYPQCKEYTKVSLETI